MSSTKRPCPIFRPAEPVKKSRKNKVINEKWSKMQRDADICLGRVQDIMEEQRARIEYLEARNSELVEENIRLKQQGAKLNHQQVYNEATKALDSGFYTDTARLSSLENPSSLNDFSFDLNKNFSLDEKVKIDSDILLDDKHVGASSECDISLNLNPKEEVVNKSDENTKSSSLDVKSSLPPNVLSSDLILHGGLQNFGTNSNDDSSNGRGLPGSSETTSFLEKMQQERRFQFNPMLAAMKQKPTQRFELKTPKSEKKVKNGRRISPSSKPYECQYCHSRFTRSDNLRRHEKLHTGENVCTCNACGKVFTRKDDMRRHQYKCPANPNCHKTPS